MKKKYTFFIEGADNVGKTTMISSLKSDTYIDNIKSSIKNLTKSEVDEIVFNKYPTNDITDLLNNNIKIEESLKKDIQSNTDDISIIDQYNDIINQNIEILLNDMKKSFVYSTVKNSKILDISDRGFLSTYMYQYRSLYNDMNNNIIGKNEEAISFFTFISSYIKYLIDPFTSINIILLNNNNPLLKLNIDTSEDIEYKKNFDEDKNLQTRINSTISNIINLITINDEFNIALNNMSSIKVYYIDIYDSNRRKTPNELCDEFIKIASTHMYMEENKNEFI